MALSYFPKGFPTSVSSALQGLTSGFGMGPGVPPALIAPGRQVYPGCRGVSSAKSAFIHGPLE